MSYRMEERRSVYQRQRQDGCEYQLGTRKLETRIGHGTGNKERQSDQVVRLRTLATGEDDGDSEELTDNNKPGDG